MTSGNTCYDNGTCMDYAVMVQQTLLRSSIDLFKTQFNRTFMEILCRQYSNSEVKVLHIFTNIDIKSVFFYCSL